jgi:hypothetical protein
MLSWSFVTASRIVPPWFARGSSGSKAMLDVEVAIETLWTRCHGHFQ